MARFADIDRIARQGLDEPERSFIEVMLANVVDSIALGMGAERDPDFEMEAVYPTNAGVLWALNQPVSLAAVVDDVCHTLGVTAPWSVRVALGSDDPEAA